jgi:hypothetical protein
MSADMNQTIAQASLDNLNDIIVPEAVGFFPLAPGWMVVILLALGLLFHFLFQAYKGYQRSLYKREALKELDSYNKESRDEMIALITLAKRVAIAAYGRNEIARLSGESWWDFMEEYSKVKMSRKLRAELSDLLYGTPQQNDTSQYTVVKDLVTLWIRTHKVTDHA